MTPTRRTFLAAAGVLAAGRTAPAAGRAVRLGGPIFQQSDDPRELAREHRRLGYSAAYCPDSEVEDAARNREIVKAFAAENVVIAEVGAWKNMMDPDSDKRRENRQYVTQRMALAEAVGARCCVDIAGSYNTTSWLRAAREESEPGILRRHGGELPQRDRCGEAHAQQIHHRDDGLARARRSGELFEADQGRGPPGVRRPYGRVQRHQ